MIDDPKDFLVNEFQKFYTIDPLCNFFMDFLGVGRYVIFLSAHFLQFFWMTILQSQH